MNNNPNDEIDPIAMSILLLLSGGQKLSLYDLTKILEKTISEVRKAVCLLKNMQLLSEDKGRSMIIENGIEFLAKRGISASMPDDDPDPKSFRNKFKLPLFGSLNNLITWTLPMVLLFFIIILLIVFVVLWFQTTSDAILALGGLVFLAVLMLYIKRSYRNVMETERLVIFRMGKSIGAKGPGPIMIIPAVDNPKLVDMRDKSKEVKKETCITKDKIMLSVGFVITWNVDNPVLCLTKTSDAEERMVLFSTAVLRTVVSDYTMDEVLQKRKSINNLVRIKVENIAYEWGLSLNSLEIREIEPPEEIVKSIQNQYAAKLNKRTHLTQTDAQVESLRKLFAVGSQMDDRTLNLKYLETLTKIGEGPSTKYVIPMEFFRLLEDWVRAQTHRDGRFGGNNNSTGQVPPPAEL